MPKSYLFVYGTLMSNSTKPLKQLFPKLVEFVSKGYLYGKLYEIDNYPGLKLSKNPKEKERVYGEIYRLKNSYLVLKALDEYEECSAKFPKPHEYRRIKTDVFTLEGKRINAWVYKYNHPTINFQQLQTNL